jgi:ribosomal protein S27AE
MGLGSSQHVTLTASETGKDPGENWLEMLRQWLVQCPQCSEVRLVVGAHEKDRYMCKDCGHSFVIGFNRGRKS